MLWAKRSSQRTERAPETEQKDHVEAPAEPAGTVLVACHSSPPVPEEPAVLLAAFRNVLLPGQPHAQPCWVLCISEGCRGPLLATAVSRGALSEGAVRQILLQSDDTDQVRAKPAAVKYPTAPPFPKGRLFCLQRVSSPCLSL